MPSDAPTVKIPLPEPRDGSFILALATALPVVAIQLALTIVIVVQHGSLLILRPGAGPIVAFVLDGLSVEIGFALACAAPLLVRNRRLRAALALSLQLVGAAIILLDIASYGYAIATMDALDAPMILHFLRTPSDLWLILSGEAKWGQWLALVAAVLSELAGPRLLVRLLRGSYHLPRSRTASRVAVLAAAPACAALALLTQPFLASDLNIARSPALEAVTSAVAPWEPPEEEASAVTANDFFEPGQLAVEWNGTAEHRNVVLIALESTRASAVTPYPPHLPTTPFLASIAAKSLLVEHAYAVMPSTAKALTAIFCSIHPSISLEPRALNANLLGRCLPQLLREQGYDTVFFQSADARFEHRRRAIDAMGFARFIEANELSHAGFETPNFLGIEDDVMLAPSRDWIHEHKDRPFFAAYLTVNAHHEYNRLTRHGVQHYPEAAGDDSYDSYLNNVHADDAFLEQLVADYAREGLLDKTLFVIVGDHGEAFGEHGRRAHNSVPYEEGLHVPLLFWDPTGRLIRPGTLQSLVSELDLMPTVLELLGYRTVRGRMHGLSLLGPLPQQRVLISSCMGGCAARITATEKFIHHFDRRADELFDLHDDPAEQHDLASAHPEIVARRRHDVLEFQKHLSSFFFVHRLHSDRGAGAIARPSDSRSAWAH